MVFGFLKRLFGINRENEKPTPNDTDNPNLLNQRNSALKPSFSKDPDRYYFYNDRCSFKLPKEEIINVNVEKGGFKYILKTNSMSMLILEIRPGMPSFPSYIKTKQITVAGFPSLAAIVNPLKLTVTEDYDQYFINCKDFVVQVTTPLASEKFLNSFRLETAPDLSPSENLQDHVPDFAYEAAGPITNQRVGLTGLLPSFADMKKDATAEEVMRVAALTNTILNLTFKNPFPIDQDPVFSVVLKANNEWAKEQLATGKCKIEAHEELKETYEGKYSAEIAKQMMEIDYWNQRMIEHAALTKTLGPKPAFQCLQAALNLTSFAGDACAILIVNYSHLLLKCSMLKLQNPAVVGDIKQVLKQASSYLHFDEGMEYAQQ